jgi:hypothetical protein
LASWRHKFSLSATRAGLLDTGSNWLLSMTFDRAMVTDSAACLERTRTRWPTSARPEIR